MFKWFQRQKAPEQGPPTEFDAKGLKLQKEVYKSEHPGVTWWTGTWKHRKGTIEQVMIRIVELEAIDEQYKKELTQERSVFKMFSHRNILRVLGVFDEVRPDRTLIVFERARCTLGTLVQKDGALPERQTQIYMGQMAQALDYLHGMKAAHTQINPESMLVTSPQRCLLTKLNKVKMVTEKYPFMTEQNNDPSYSAPEMADRTKPYQAKPADIFALGCVIYFCLKGQTMFKNPLTEHVDTQKRIQDIECEECQSILSSLLVYDPDKRLTISDVVRHNWFVSFHKTSPHLLYRPEPIPQRDLGRTLTQLGPSTAGFIEKMSAAGYSVQYKIAEGAYGAVYRGMKRTRDGEVPVALKVIKGLNKREQKPYVQRGYPLEMKVAETFKHPNLVLTYDVFREKNTKGRKHDRRAFIWMELAKCDLAVMISESGKLTEQQTMKWMKESVNGLKYLYDSKIAHRDIKPANILIMEDGTAKVTDYSVVREIDYDKLSDTCVGTEGYTSPQVMAQSANNPFKGDAWSLGIVMFECLTGRRPDWYPQWGNFGSIMREYDNLAQDVRASIRNSPILEVVTMMLQLNESTRWDMDQIYNDPLFFGKYSASKPMSRTAAINKRAGTIGNLSSFSDSKSASKSDSYPGVPRGAAGFGVPKAGFGRRGGRGGGGGGGAGMFDLSFSQSR